MNDDYPAIIKPALEAAFISAWENCRVILFSAPCGCGKTTCVRALLKGLRVFCPPDGSEFAPEDVPSGCQAVLVDDLQYISDARRQQALCELIRRRTELRFVMLGRCRIPGWLMPFQLAGVMKTFETGDLMMDRDTSARMLSSRGVSVTPEELTAIFRDIKGYPIGMELLCRRLSAGASYGGDVFDAVKRELFVYYDEEVYRRFDAPLRNLLVSVAPFDSFHLELARMVSGEARAGELLGAVQRDTTMLLFDGLYTYRFWPIFREFLLWEMQQTLTDADKRGIFSRAALYYELNDDPGKALDCYLRAGDNGKVSALLVKNAETHPGAGHYREMQDYYFALPREEILRSPSLICGMSMLSALCMDYDASEQWYAELQTYAARLKKTDSEYAEVRGKLLYLDIALPQRGSKGLVDVISKVFRVMSDKQASVPSFSVTSTLPSVMNGGKDFCDWSKMDDVLYATMKRPVETVLGRDGVGLSDCALCESKFEKGEDVSKQLLTLMAKLGEIQTRGTPDIEFAVMGLLARVQISQGKASAAAESIESLRARYAATGQTRFIGNIDALLCRIRLRTGDEEWVREWLRTAPAKNDVRLWALWRYQYLTRAMALMSIGETDEPMLLLARLAPYCRYSGRVMDGIHIRILSALCRRRRGDDEWKADMRAALDTCLEYKFIWPIAQYGAEMLPMLKDCGWDGNGDFVDKAVAAARNQAVLYPRFLRPQARQCEALSAAETQVLRLLCENLSNQDICEILDIKLPTVKTHVTHILQKLGVKRRGEAKDAAEKLHLL